MLSVWDRKRYWGALILVILLSAGYAYYRDLPGLYRSLQEYDQEVIMFDQELEDSEAHEEFLKERLEPSNQDSFESERILRDAGYVAPGEKIYKIEPKESTPTTQP